MFRRWLALAITATVMATLAGADCPSALAETAWYEGFEGPDTSWRDAGGDVQYRIEFQRRVQGEAHVGDGCERIRLNGSGGSQVFVSHDVGRARVIDELSPTVWIRSDRSGLQMLARIVFPRAVDPRTGQPVSTLISGSSYTKVGRWEQLRVGDIPRQVTRQIRVLRTQLGPQLDAREAYLDRILLNVYGGPGITNVWIDDLDIGGYVAADPAAPPAAAAGGGLDWRSATPSPPFTGPGPIPPPDTARPAAGNRPGVELVRSILLAGGHEIFPRAIQYRGEPLSTLKELGFNTIWLPMIPDAAMLEEAQQLGLWLICPPPTPIQPAGPEGSAGPLPEIGPSFDRVLAWDLSPGSAAGDFDSIKQWAERVRRADSQKNRPTICRVDSELRSYSRHVQLLLVSRSPLGTSLELPDYGRWIRQRPLLALPGTPIWTTVETQPPDALLEQWRMLGAGSRFP